MSVLAKDSKQLNYIYNSDSQLGKKVLGYVQSIDLDIKTTDISKDKFGDTIWVEISKMLDLDFKEILSPEHPDVPNEFKDGNFDTNGWLKILKKNPILLQNAIAVNGERAKLIKSRADILEFYGVDSAGLEQCPEEGEPDIASNTENETFVPQRNHRNKS